MRRVVEFLRREDGATAAEYAVGLACVALALALVVGLLNNSAGQAFQSMSGSVGTYGS